MPRAVSADRPRSKPKLGQHFLNEEEYARRIVEALGDISQSTVLEIGPGRGILTEQLGKRARRLIAVEMDRVLAAQLRLKFGMNRNVEIIEADVLSIDIDSLFGPKPGLGRPGIELKPEPVKVVGNLPYYITSDIVLRLFEFAKYFDCMVIMVQREVADRIAAEPGGRDYGVLSATAQLHARVEKLFTVPPGAFSPPPKVFSAVRRRTRDPQPHKTSVGPGSLDHHGSAAAKTRSGGRWLHQLPASLVYTKAQDAMEQLERELRQQPIETRAGGSESETHSSRRNSEPGAERRHLPRLA